MKYTVNCCIIFSVTASPCIQSTVSEMQRTCRSKNTKRKKSGYNVNRFAAENWGERGTSTGDALPPGHAGLSLCATEPIARAAPSSETWHPSSMARCDSNNCLSLQYMARRYRRICSLGCPMQGPSQPMQRQQAEPKVLGLLPNPRAARPAAAWHGVQGQAVAVLCPGAVLWASSGTAWTVAEHGTQDNTAPAALRHHGTQHHSQHRTAATPLHQGDAAASTAPVWQHTGHCSWMETALLGPPRSAICLPGLASVNWIQPYVTGYYFATFIWVSALFDYKPVPTQLQTHRWNGQRLRAIL